MFRITLLILSITVFACADTDRAQVTMVSNDTQPNYLNPDLSVDERVKDLMNRMTLEEKVWQMCQYVGPKHMQKAEKDLSPAEMQQSDAQGFYLGLFSPGIKEMTTRGEIGSFLHVLDPEEANELQKLAMQSRLKIPVLIGIDAIHGNALVRGATVYPSPITLAATWNDELQYEIGRQTAREMRATGSHWAFTPNIDVLRDPRWGRTGETYGEDPYLVGNMGVQTILGLQTDDFTGTDKVIACAKHLVAGSQSVNGLNSAPTDVSMRTLREIFLPPYRRAIREANIFSIMAAHNEVNGIPAHMDDYLMTDLLREQWGFDGFYVSDWNDVSRISTLHRVAETFEEASKMAVNAGLDMHMHGPDFPDHIVAGVKNGTVAEARVDEACSKVLEAKFKLGLFENPYVDLDRVDDEVFTETHQQTALQAARDAIVLLKNKNNTLPLARNTNTDSKTIFITGPNADNMTTLGDWASPQPEDRLVTMREGIEQLSKTYGYQTRYAAVNQRSREITDDEIQTAKQGAATADVVVLVVGENSFRHDWKNKTTGENIDRATLQLSGKQLKLAKQLHATGKPLVVVYVTGSPVAEPWIQNNAAAVLKAWEPGSFGGQAVAEILFGEVNPSGKLPVTVPRSVGQLQMVYNYKPSAYKHRYHTTPKKPLHPFGYGLSYTSYRYDTPQVSGSVTATDNATVTVQITNTGKMAGEEIVQLYIRDEFSSITRPVKELKGYQRLSLQPGETKTATFTLTPESLAFYDRDYNYGVEAGDFTIMVGSSSADKDLKTTQLSVAANIEVNE